MYIRFAPTDLSLYDRNDTEHVGWYWQPYDAGKPIWMMPYHNKNNDIMMISYVVPLYCEGQFIGVVGMDFDYTVLTDRVKDIKVYENGFAYLNTSEILKDQNGFLLFEYQSGDGYDLTEEAYRQILYYIRTHG